MASTSLDAKYPVQVLCRIADTQCRVLYADAPSSTQYQEVKEAIVHRSDCTKKRLYKEATVQRGQRGDSGDRAS